MSMKPRDRVKVFFTAEVAGINPANGFLVLDAQSFETVEWPQVCHCFQVEVPPSSVEVIREQVVF